MMPSGSYSLDTLLEFLKYAGMEGLINPAAARSRRNAVRQLAGELSAGERADVRTLDLADLASRFHKLDDASLRKEALELYIGRFATARADFLSWCEHPAAFRPAGDETPRSIARGPGGRSGISAEQEVAEKIALVSIDHPLTVVPVALGENRTVHIAGLPDDLTRAEAERICRVIQAFAVDGGREGAPP